jgi:hypothetical protein
MAKTKTATKNRTATKATARKTAEPKAPARSMRDGTKQKHIVDLLRRAEGATIAEMAEATNWQAHSVRGLLAGALKTKLGLTIVSDKTDERGRVYRVV